MVSPGLTDEQIQKLSSAGRELRRTFEEWNAVHKKRTRLLERISELDHQTAPLLEANDRAQAAYDLVWKEISHDCE